MGRQAQEHHGEAPPVASGAFGSGGPPGMTYDEFLDWLDEDTLAEWVGGKVIMASPASERHQEIGAFLLTLLRAFVQVHQLGSVLNAPFQMKIGRSGREPDLFYLATAHQGRMKRTYLDGPADLVVEIISPESAGRDRGDKFYEYQDAGIPEYWLIDPDRQVAEFYQLDDRGHYQLVAPDGDGRYHSRTLAGFWVRVAWLWQNALPDTTGALLEIDRDAYGAYLREQLRQAGM